MRPKNLNIEVILVYFLLLIPWPDTRVIKLLCSQDSSRLVRKIVRSKWTPILDKYQVKLPLECPLHPLRDLYGPRQDAKKRDRPTQWTCGQCGKSFYQEKFLDLHFETRHKNIINKDEDAVCLADLCDILRCDVFQSEDSSSLTSGDRHTSTDIEVWGDSMGLNSALAKANAAYLSLLPLRTSVSIAKRALKLKQDRQSHEEKMSQNRDRESQKLTNHDKNADTEHSKIINDSAEKHSESDASRKAGMQSDETKHSKSTTTTNQSDDKLNRNGADDGDDNNNDSSSTADPSASSSSSSCGNDTQNENAQNSQKLRSNCRAEELSKLRIKCERLVRSCIVSSLLGMTSQAFKEMEEEMNKAVCWYLSCDRYWEDGPLEPRAFPWGLIVILVFVLSMGICFCYYIIWILFDSEEATISTNQQSYEHHHQHLQQQQPKPQPYQQHGILHSSTTPQHYYYQQQQQQQQHELYAEQPRYDYRHSPRRYSERTHQGTPVAGGHSAVAAGHHQQPSGHYQADIFDRRDYTNRGTSTPIPTTAVGGHSQAAAGMQGATHSHPPATVEQTAAQLATIDGGTRHYNPNQHHSPLEPHHRHIGASQTSLRGSASAHEIIQSDVGHNEHYIYVTYPPDLKKRFFEKYE